MSREWESRFRRRSRAHGSCHGGPQDGRDGLPRVAIVGPPNVGKALLFNRLTGAYATVSTSPGTTVEVAGGRARLAGCAGEIEIVDTPGMYDLSPLSEEERVARRILLQERPSLVLHVTDAKNIPRMLPMTLALMEAGLPVALAVNLPTEVGDRAGGLECAEADVVLALCGAAGEGSAEPLALRLAESRHTAAQLLLDGVMREGGFAGRRLAERRSE